MKNPYTIIIRPLLTEKNLVAKGAKPIEYFEGV
jgi:hypothetical protein